VEIGKPHLRDPMGVWGAGNNLHNSRDNRKKIQTHPRKENQLWFLRKKRSHVDKNGWVKKKGCKNSGQYLAPWGEKDCQKKGELEALKRLHSGSN